MTSRIAVLLHILYCGISRASSPGDDSDVASALFLLQMKAEMDPASTVPLQSVLHGNDKLIRLDSIDESEMVQDTEVQTPDDLFNLQAGPKHNKRKQHQNVLFFMIDDLRPNLGAYNFTMTKTPNMDWIASEGLTFTRAYANYPWCAPSRNSFLSGRTPDFTRDYNFVDHFREEGIGENWRSLPQYFKEKGYITATSGKFFHKMKPPNNDYPTSWSLKPFTPYCTAPEQCPDSTATFGTHAHGHFECVQKGWSWCAMDISKEEDRDDYQLEDQRIAVSCMSQLDEMHKQDPDQPFFLGCGFHKPHAPWVFPAEFLKDFPEDIMEIPLPADAVSKKPEGMPAAAYHPPMDIKNAIGGGDNATDTDTAKRYNRRAYYASVNYVDWLVGNVINKLRDLDKLDSTVIVVTGDHGWHLGEQDVWGKMTNFENGLRVPLIVRSPAHKKTKGMRTDELAELVDLYPTLAELAGLPHPKDDGEDINGTSLLAVFEKADANVKKFALSQVAKPSLAQPDMISVSQRRNETEIMGYSLRNNNWRYTVWFKFNGQNQVPIVDEDEGIIGRELYNHQKDGEEEQCANGGFDSLAEMRNLAEREDHQEIIGRLHREMLHRISLRSVKGVERFYPADGDFVVALRVPEDSAMWSPALPGSLTHRFQPVDFMHYHQQ